MGVWYRLTARRQKWILWSVAALVVLAIGTRQHGIWGIGAVVLGLWAITDT